MADTASKDPSPAEIAAILDKIMDDESTGQYVYFIPLRYGVEIGMSHPDFIVSTIVSVCRQVLKRLLQGKSRNDIREYLIETIGYDERFARMAIGQTLDCATITAKIMEGKLTHDQAVAELMTAKNADIRAVTGMLKMVSDVVAESNGACTAEKLGALQEAVTPLSGYYWIINLLAVVAWPGLCFGAGFRWWTGLLCAIAFYFIGTVVMAVIDMKLEK